VTLKQNRGAILIKKYYVLLNFKLKLNSYYISS
jgi:hypothetical protein